MYIYMYICMYMYVNRILRVFFGVELYAIEWILLGLNRGDKLFVVVVKRHTKNFKEFL